jgi:hypothetical protein
MSLNIIAKDKEPSQTNWKYWVEVNNWNCWFTVEHYRSAPGYDEYTYSIKWWNKMVPTTIKKREQEIIEQCKEILL